MWKLTYKNLRANLTRLVSTAVAVITGTAFVACGLVLTGAIANAVDGNVAEQYAGVDAAVTPAAPTNDQGPTNLQGVNADLLGTLRKLPEVAAADGELVAPARILDSQGDAFRSQMLGRAWIVDDELNPFTLAKGDAPKAAGEIAVDRQTSDDDGVEVGKSYKLATPSGPMTAKVVGITEFGRAASVDGGGTVFFAPDAALDVLGAGSDKFGQILMRTDGSTADLVTAAEAVTPANDTVLDGKAFMERATADTQAFVDFLRPVLLGFAFLALFVAGFVIYNTFSVVVTQRSRELALVRSIGGTPSQVRRSLLGEGLLLGFGASVVGMAVGVALSWLLGWILERLDVGLPSAGFSLSPWTVVITLLAGTVITVISVTIPAFRAGRTRPVEAMRDTAIDHSGSSKFRLYIGGALLIIGISALLFNRFVNSHPVILGLGALTLFWGVVIGGPLLARLFGQVMRVVLKRSLTGRVAAENLVRNPKRTATTANALVIGLFLVTLVTVSGTALRDWSMSELAKFSASDFMVVGITPIPSDVVEKISDLDGVQQAAPVRSAQVTDASGTTAQLSGANIDELVNTMGLKASSGSLADVAAGKGAASTGFDQMGGGSSGAGPSSTGPSSTGPPVDIGESGTSTSGASVGQVYLLKNNKGETVDVPVAAVLDLQLDTLFLGTLVNNGLFTEIAGEQPVSQVYIRADQNKVDALGTELDNLLDDYTGIQAVPGNFIGQILGRIIDFMIAAVNGLLGLSVVIALIGIVNTMNLSIHERRRELGMVRALGMLKSQVRSMVRIEAFAMGILGTVVGVGAGVFCGWVVIGSITDTSIPLAWGRVGLITAVGLVISVLASLWPAHRSTKVDMLEAMAAT